MGFADTLEVFGEKTALITEGGELITYSKLACLSDGIFKDSPHQPPPRALVAIECINSLNSICAYLGALRLDYPVLLIDGNQERELKESLYSHYQIPYIVNASGELHKLSHKPVAVNSELSLLLSTSGSTGSPKLVRLSKKSINANAKSIAQYLKINPNSRGVTSLPMHYSYGLSVINSHLHLGASISITKKSITEGEFWNVMRSQKVNLFSGVPKMYSILKQMRFERMDLPSLQVMTQAGGRLSPELCEWFGNYAHDSGKRFYVMYGQTEACARMAYLPPEKLLIKKSSVGIPIPGGKMELVDECGNVIQGAYTEGEIKYSGINVMLGYAQNISDLNLPNCQNGELLTGDLGYFDEDNFFYITGRKQRFIKIFGNRIGLDEVEMYLAQQGVDAVVTGVDDLLGIFIVDIKVDISSISQKLSNYYKLHITTIRVLILDGYPTLSSGKIDYKSLCAILEK